MNQFCLKCGVKNEFNVNFCFQFLVLLAGIAAFYWATLSTKEE